MTLRANNLAGLRMLRGRHGVRAGFTMLEILLAMTVLVIIVLMLTMVFDQSASTWESGIRETGMAVEGRTILSLIAADLERAVMNQELFAAPPDDYKPRIAEPDSLCFHYLGEPETNGWRALKGVMFRREGKEIIRETWNVRATGSDPSFFPYNPQNFAQASLSDRVFDFQVAVPGSAQGAVYTNNLPAWVDVKIWLTESVALASQIEVRSAGPDGNLGTDDDLVE